MNQEPTKAMEIERPSKEFVRKVNKSSRIFTVVAVTFCAGVYYVISRLYAGDAIQTQARFNTVFQSLLVAAWTWFMFPYIRVTLQMMLYGLDLNERTASFFSKPEESPLIQYIEKRLNESKKDFEVWKRLGEKIEAELPIFLKKVDEGFAELREASKKVSAAVEKSDSLVIDAKPAIEALRRIEARVEQEIKAGIMDDIRTAAASIRTMGGLPPKEEAQEEAQEEGLSSVIQSLQKSKTIGRAS